jgi:hypothetical protein
MENDAVLALYVIGPQRSGPFKIGLTTNLASRLQSLQTGHHRRLRIFWSGQCPNQAWERYIHKALAPWRMSGEWFNVPLETAFDAIFLVATLDGIPGESEIASADSRNAWAELMQWPAKEAS